MSYRRKLELLRMIEDRVLDPENEVPAATADHMLLPLVKELRQLIDGVEEAQDSDRYESIRSYAREQYEKEGEIEFDEGAAVSEGSEHGAYVQAWCWVSFSAWELDKEEE